MKTIAVAPIVGPKLHRDGNGVLRDARGKVYCPCRKRMQETNCPHCGA